MLELTRKYQFHAARKLTSLPDSHPCSKIHGHTFSVIIKLNGEIDESKGWVIDFLVLGFSLAASFFLVFLSM